MKVATSQDEYGYIVNGEETEPTDAQTNLQDEIDGAIQALFDTMRELYANASGKDIPEVEHDISKLTDIREKVEQLLELPDVY